MKVLRNVQKTVGNKILEQYHKVKVEHYHIVEVEHYHRVEVIRITGSSWQKKQVEQASSKGK